MFLVTDYRARQKRHRTEQHNQSRPGIPPDAIRSRQIRFAPAQHNDGDIGHRIVRDKEKRQRSQHRVEGSADNEKDGGDGAQEEGHGRRAASINSRGFMMKQFVATHRVKNSGCGQRVGIDRAQQRKNRQHPDGLVSVSTKDFVGDGARREVFAGELGHGQHVNISQVHNDIDRDHEEHAAKHRADHIAFGIANLFAKIDHPVPTIVGVQHALQRND